MERVFLAGALALGLLLATPGSAIAQPEPADGEASEVGEAAEPEAAEPEAAEPEAAEPEAAEPEPARAPRMDLAAFIAAAERTYPNIEARRHAIDAAEARLGEARISPFMQYTGRVGFTVAPEAHGTPIFSEDDQFPAGNQWRPVVSLRVQGVIPLSITKLQDVRRAARAGVAAARGDERRSLDRVRFDVRRAYFGLQLSLDILQMISEVEGKLRRAVRRLRRQVEDEDPEVDETDLFRLDRALTEILARKSETQRLERAARAGLRALTGAREFRIPECPIERVDFELQAPGTYIAQALGERPEVAMLDAAVQARRAGLRLDAAGYAPDVGIALYARYSHGPGITDQTNPFITDPANYSTAGAALVARWSLDFWGNSYRVRRSRALLAQTEAQREEARRGMTLEVELARDRLSDAMEREQIWSRSRRETRRWFVSSAQGYQIGAIEASDLVDAVKGYMTARLEHLNAVRQVNESIARLERVTGSPLVEPGAWEACEE